MRAFALVLGFGLLAAGVPSEAAVSPAMLLAREPAGPVEPGGYLVSEKYDESQSANKPSTSPTISADGRYVAFSSRAEDLNQGGPFDGNDAFDIFRECFERGVLIRTTGDIIALSPPLIVEESHIDQAISTIADVLKSA